MRPVVGLAVLDLLTDRENGVRHLVNPGFSDGVGRGSPVRLATVKGCLLPRLPDAIGRFQVATAHRAPTSEPLLAAE